VARRLARPSVLAGAAILLLLVACALGAPWIAPHDPHAIRTPLRFLPPAWQEGGQAAYPLGTDQLGRDILSRLVYGARTSLLIATAAVALSATAGVLLGLAAGYFRGPVDTLVMRLADVQLAFPFILLALAILAVSGEKTALRIVIVLAVADWVIHARVIRGRVLVEREREYVRAARALGASHPRVMFLYILPVLVPTAIVIATLELAVLMLVESILAFLGLGIDPPGVSWGTILADGRVNVAIAWWMLAFPGAAVFLAVLGVNLLADGLADVLDPRLKLTGRYTRWRRAWRRRPVPPTPPVRDLSEGALLEVRGLRVEFPTDDGVVTAVRDVSFQLAPGGRLGIVGESGSGKSVTALSVIGLLDAPGRVTAGSIRFKGRELVGLPERQLNRVRGGEIAMIFQDPGTSLNPTLKIGYQVAEAVTLHRPGVGRQAAREQAVEALRLVSIRDPRRVADAYPFQISGGMQQRAMIAMALSCSPDLLIADEPTTALDVTTQDQILRELDALVERLGTGVILISHDLSVVAEFTDHTVVMYAGTVCETGPTEALVRDPRHPYTQALLAAVEELDVTERGRLGVIPGDPPDPRQRPPGCPFAPRCPHAMEVCRVEEPASRRLAGDVTVACHLYREETVGRPAAR
jgi:peptide/nickel transport system ATP-binding protein/peptide/nickel transport system permease protein